MEVREVEAVGTDMVGEGRGKPVVEMMGRAEVEAMTVLTTRVDGVGAAVAEGVKRMKLRVEGELGERAVAVVVGTKGKGKGDGQEEWSGGEGHGGGRKSGDGSDGGGDDSDGERQSGKGYHKGKHGGADNYDGGGGGKDGGQGGQRGKGGWQKGSSNGNDENEGGSGSNHYRSGNRGGASSGDDNSGNRGGYDAQSDDSGGGGGASGRKAYDHGSPDSNDGPDDYTPHNTGSDDSPSSSSLARSDCSHLMQFYDAMSGSSWSKSEGWADDSDTACCGWFGVTCNKAHRVVALDLDSNGLSGTLSSAVFQLEMLLRL